MEFKLEENRISLELEGGQEAFITFGIDKEKGIIVVSTTYVPENHRGKGLAGKLSQKLVEFADRNGYKIYPLCSYTQKFLMRKRPDLIAEVE
jgi:predicted GNAT family acetyltransferase